MIMQQMLGIFFNHFFQSIYTLFKKAKGIFPARTNKDQTTVLYSHSQTTKPGNFIDEKRTMNRQELKYFKKYAHTCEIKILNSLNTT